MRIQISAFHRKGLALTLQDELGAFFLNARDKERDGCDETTYWFMDDSSMHVVCEEDIDAIDEGAINAFVYYIYFRKGGYFNIPFSSSYSSGQSPESQDMFERINVLKYFDMPHKNDEEAEEGWLHNLDDSHDQMQLEFLKKWLESKPELERMTGSVKALF